MPRTILTLLLAALLVVSGYAPAQRVRPIAPSSQPASAPATSRPLVVHTCYIEGGRTHDVGRPRMVQVEPQWFGDKVGALLAIDAAALMDFEPAGRFIYTMQPGLVSRTTAKGPVAEISELVDGCRAWCRLLREAAPTRRIVLYSNFPLGSKWQYGGDQRPYVVDNRRIVNAGAFEFADALAVHAYLSGDDIHWMRPVDAADYTRKRIEAARVAGKPLVIVLSPYYCDHGGAVPAAILAAQVAVIRDTGVELCWWTGNVNATTARRLSREAALVEAVK